MAESGGDGGRNSNAKDQRVERLGGIYRRGTSGKDGDSKEAVVGASGIALSGDELSEGLARL